MTQQQLIEVLQLSHPERGETYLRIMMNMALSEYADETRVLRGEAELVIVEGAVKYAAPADFIAAREVYAESGAEVDHSAPYSFHLLPHGTPCWFVEKDAEGHHIIIGRVQRESGRATLVPLEAGQRYVLRYVRQARAFTAENLSQEIDLPLSLQGAIEAHVQNRLYAGQPDMQRAWYGMYRTYVQKGKRQAAVGGDEGQYNVLIHEL